jgi:heme exporter protein C
MRTLFIPVLTLTAAMFALAPVMIARAPYESTMLLVQKIFYFHAPSWFAMFAGVGVAGIRGHRLSDAPRAGRMAVSASEILLMFGAMGLTTGPIWARKAWGVAWQWDAKLTIALLLELIFVAYLLLRRFGGAGSERLAAAVALFGLAVAPFVYYAVNIWRTVHPSTSVVPTLGPGMFGAFWYCVTARVLRSACALKRVESVRRSRRAVSRPGGLMARSVLPLILRLWPSWRQPPPLNSPAPPPTRARSGPMSRRSVAATEKMPRPVCHRCLRGCMAPRDASSARSGSG